MTALALHCKTCNARYELIDAERATGDGIVPSCPLCVSLARDDDGQFIRIAWQEKEGECGS